MKFNKNKWWSKPKRCRIVKQNVLQKRTFVKMKAFYDILFGVAKTFPYQRT